MLFLSDLLKELNHRTIIDRAVRLATLVLTSLPFIGPVCPQTHDKAPTIHVDVDLISVTVRVTDKQGGNAVGLAAGDFALFEDGKRQKISFFDTEKEPISLCILVDSSNSMNADAKVSSTQEIVKQLISRSRPEDQTWVLQFTDRVLGFKEITREQRGPTLSTGMTSESGGAAIYDALASALCHLRTSKNLRQAIVVLTDGVEQYSRLKLEQLLRLVRSSRAQLFIIGFYPGVDYASYKQSDRMVTLVTGREVDNPITVFDKLAKESGTKAFFPTTEKSLAQAVNDVLVALRAQYTLSYYPQGSTNRLRRVQVKLNRGGFKISARQTIELQDPAGEGIQFDGDSCIVSAKAYPYPYEARLTESGATLHYREDFSDERTGWPNHTGSRYISNAYELSSSLPNHQDTRTFLGDGPIQGYTDKVFEPRPILAGYGPWWDESSASVWVDAGWAKMRSPTQMRGLKSRDVLDTSSAGLAFRMRDAGYYAFLLSTSREAYEADQLSFKLVKRTYREVSEEPIVPWTRISATQVQQAITSGVKLTVVCHGEEIILFVNDQQVGHIRDATYDSGFVGLVLLGTGRAIFRNLDVAGTR
jgi:Ca-activated chloride channel family protein